MEISNPLQKQPLGPHNNIPRTQPGNKTHASKLRLPFIRKRSSPEQIVDVKKCKYDNVNSDFHSSNSSSIVLGKITNKLLMIKGNNENLERNRIDFSHVKPVLTLNKPKLIANKSLPPKAASKGTVILKPVSKTSMVKGKNISKSSTCLTRATSTVSVTGKKHRPAWDLKGKLQDMEENLIANNLHNESLCNQLANNNQCIAVLENNNRELNEAIKIKDTQNSLISHELDQLKKSLREKEEGLREISHNYKIEIEGLNCQVKLLMEQLKSIEIENSSLTSTITQLNSVQSHLKAELSSLQLNLTIVEKDNVSKSEEITSLRDLIKTHEESILDLNQKLHEDEILRRHLHNTIQELKGNIRVFCRVRPLVGDELLGNTGEITHMNFSDSEQKIIEVEKLSDLNINESIMNHKKGTSNKYEFKFDHVFKPSSSQSEVFEEISQLIQSALDGYNVCIFAYGQTGSGKTYTMEGPGEDDPETWGMIPRTVQQIFCSASDLESKGWKYEMEASFLEIYNEQIRDLLGSGKENLKHEIRLIGTKSTDVMVTNLVTVIVKTPKQVIDLLRKASNNRAVAATGCNERSSRSHSVFRLKLSGENELTGENCQSTLNLVDLAGSERLKESNSQGDRLKETQNINRSLSNLGNVIMSLANKEQHIPYRNSKLTHLLQNSLGGNSKTLMFANVSPKQEHFSETLCSLRFATKVNQCNIGTAQKKVR